MNLFEYDSIKVRVPLFSIYITICGCFLIRYRYLDMIRKLNITPDRMMVLIQFLICCRPTLKNFIDQLLKLIQNSKFWLKQATYCLLKQANRPDGTFREVIAGVLNQYQVLLNHYFYDYLHYHVSVCISFLLERVECLINFTMVFNGSETARRANK